MKTNVLLTIVLFVCNMAFAQKVDLDRYSYSGGAHYRLPNNPLADDYKTYNLKIASNGAVRNSYPDDRVESKIKINGWRALASNQKAHVTINVTLTPLVISKSEVVERKEETKDKSGKVTSKSFFKALFEYKMEGNSVSFSDYKGTKIPLTFTSRYLGSHQSDEYSSYAMARDYIANNRDNLKDKFIGELVDNLCTNASNATTSAWGLTEVVHNSHFWLMDSKKHPEHDSMQTMAKFMKEEMSKFSLSESNAASEERLLPFINYLKNLPNKYKTDEKGDKKLRYAAYYNLAKISYYLDKTADIRKYADLLVKNDYDPSDAKDFIKDAEELEAAFKKNNVNTRHLSFDISSFEGPK